MPRLEPFVFLALTLALSIPFYLWGALAPVDGLPFGLPISFLMIFVPFGLALYAAWQAGGRGAIASLLMSVADIRKASSTTLAYSLLCMPIVVALSFVTMRALGLDLPPSPTVPIGQIPLMVVLYFLGAIPEELGWTATLTAPLGERYGTRAAGVMIGVPWALWHVIPWSWAHPPGWVLGMCLLTVLMRLVMAHLTLRGGRSVFAAVTFHMTINVSMGLFPNAGSHLNPWVVCGWMLVPLAVLWRVERT